MKTTVTQLDFAELESVWPTLVEHVRTSGSEFVLLPEMIFSDWFCATDNVDSAVWQDAVRDHQAAIARFHELGSCVVTGTAPREVNGQKWNSGFVWTADSGIQWVHNKTYLPNEDMFWEVKWYDRAAIDFQSVEVNGVKIGFAICSELWFMQHAREYSRQGVHFVLNPRCTDVATTEKWLTGGRAAGVIAGAYCLSSNRTGKLSECELGGVGWISTPDGNTVAVTSADSPFVTIDLDLTVAETAKKSYPRYLDDSAV